MRWVGAHVSIGKGLIGALEKAQAMGANCIQIFSSPPQSFVPPRFTESECHSFKGQAVELDMRPIFIHATYLVNLGSDKDTLKNLSVKSLIDDLIFAEKIGAKGVIVHTGSHKGKGFTSVVPTVRDAIVDILNDTPETTAFFLEIAAGGPSKIGSSFEELQALLESVGSPRLGVCLDTAHLFAGGFDFRSEEAIQALDQKIADTVGWERVACMHVNDSKVPFGSFKDRHENLGEGMIGLKALKLLLNSSHFSLLPLIIETPGFDDKGPDKENVEILKSLLIK